MATDLRRPAETRNAVENKGNATRRRACASEDSSKTSITLPDAATHIWHRATMSSASPAPTYFIVFCTVLVLVLKAVNEEVTEPYMVRR